MCSIGCRCSMDEGYVCCANEFWKRDRTYFIYLCVCVCVHRERLICGYYYIDMWLLLSVNVNEYGYDS